MVEPLLDNNPELKIKRTYKLDMETVAFIYDKNEEEELYCLTDSNGNYYEIPILISSTPDEIKKKIRKAMLYGQLNGLSKR